MSNGSLLIERASEDKRAGVGAVADACMRAVEARQLGTVELSVTVVSAANLANDKRDGPVGPRCRSLVVDGEDINTVKTSVWNDSRPSGTRPFV